LIRAFVCLFLFLFVFCGPSFAEGEGWHGLYGLQYKIFHAKYGDFCEAEINQHCISNPTKRQEKIKEEIDKRCASLNDETTKLNCEGGINKKYRLELYYCLEMKQNEIELSNKCSDAIKKFEEEGSEELNELFKKSEKK